MLRMEVAPRGIETWVCLFVMGQPVDEPCCPVGPLVVVLNITLLVRTLREPP